MRTTLKQLLQVGFIGLVLITFNGCGDAGGSSGGTTTLEINGQVIENPDIEFATELSDAGKFLDENALYRITKGDPYSSGSYMINTALDSTECYLLFERDATSFEPLEGESITEYEYEQFDGPITINGTPYSYLVSFYPVKLPLHLSRATLDISFDRRYSEDSYVNFRISCF